MDLELFYFCPHRFGIIFIFVHTDLELFFITLLMFFYNYMGLVIFKGSYCQKSIRTSFEPPDHI